MKARLSITALLLLSTTHAFADGVSQHFEAIKHNPTQLRAFLQAMPKGGDLHNHLSGASLPENLMAYAQNDNLCVDTKKMRVYTNANCSTALLLDNYIKQPEQRDKLIDAWSMQHFKKGNESGHDHFFATFGKIHAITTEHKANILAEETARAAKQNIQYLELMATSDNNESGNLGGKLGYNPDFDVMRKNLEEHGIKFIAGKIAHNAAVFDIERRKAQDCTTNHPQPACDVKVNFEYQVYREQKPEKVFAQLLAGFEAAKTYPNIVTINLVAPEDGKISMRDYDLHMQMVGYLHKRYPTVPITLHAGELTSALVSKKGLSFHIDDAVNIAHAKRIGHGVDIANETDEQPLLTEMAKKHVMVEINLSSNEDILNVEGKKHPILLYRKHHVPVALSTDDEGISRDDLTTEFVKATNEFGFTYPELKHMVRNSLYYSFLPGKNLWNDDSYQTRVADCKTLTSQACSTFISQNEKAQMQWELERRFGEFEAGY